MRRRMTEVLAPSRSLGNRSMMKSTVDIASSSGAADAAVGPPLEPRDTDHRGDRDHEIASRDDAVEEEVELRTPRCLLAGIHQLVQADDADQCCILRRVEPDIAEARNGVAQHLRQQYALIAQPPAHADGLCCFQLSFR